MSQYQLSICLSRRGVVFTFKNNVVVNILVEFLIRDGLELGVNSSIQVFQVTGSEHLNHGLLRDLSTWTRACYFPESVSAGCCNLGLELGSEPRDSSPGGSHPLHRCHSTGQDPAWTGSRGSELLCKAVGSLELDVASICISLMTKALTHFHVHVVWLQTSVKCIVCLDFSKQIWRNPWCILNRSPDFIFFSGIDVSQIFSSGQ